MEKLLEHAIFRSIVMLFLFIPLSFPFNYAPLPLCIRYEFS